MRNLIFICILFFLTGCLDEQGSQKSHPVFDKQRFVQSVKESNLTMKQIVRHLYPVEGLEDGVPKSPIDAEFVERYGDSPFFFSWNKAKIEPFENFVLVLFHDPNDPPSIAITFDKGAKPIEALVLEDRVGNNEFSIERSFERENDGFLIQERHYETEWEVYPTKGKRVLSQKLQWHVVLRPDGTFGLK